MTALSVIPPYPLFNAIDGETIDSGFVYVGTANQNPETNPITVYWDSALTIPAEQPIRTIAGYPSRNGTPSAFYVNATDYSLTLRDRNGTLVFNSASAPLRLGTSQVDGLNASNINYTPAGSGAVVSTVQTELRKSVSVENFGAVGDGSTNDTANVQACLTANAGKIVEFLPGKTYKLNTITVPADTIIMAYGATLDFSASDQDGIVFTNGGGIYGGTLIGSDGTTFGNGSGIKASGTDNDPLPPTYITCPTIQDVTIHDFQYHGIFIEFAQHGSIKNNHVYTCGYAGIGGICVNYIDIDGNTVHGINGAAAPDTYGILLTSWESTETAHPRSTHCSIINNFVYNVPNWEGIDTHAGNDLVIAGNVVSDCRFGIAVVAGDTGGLPARGAKRVSVTGNTVSGSNNGGCITIQGSSSDHCRDISVIGNSLLNGGTVNNVNDGSIRILYCEDITITGNTITTPYCYGINLVLSIFGCVVSGNTITDPRDNTMAFPACIVVTGNDITAEISGNSMAYKTAGSGTFVSVFCIRIGSALTGLDINIGRNHLVNIQSGILSYSEGTTTGVNASGLMVQRGRAQVSLTNAAANTLAVSFGKRMPVSSPRIQLTRNGSPVPGTVTKSPQLETSGVSEAGFTIVARPYDLTTFGGAGTLEVDWTATT